MKTALVALMTLSMTLPAAAFAKEHGKADKGGHEAMERGVGMPPGLAKKPYGMPPGQAKKMWKQGERLPTMYYTQERYYVTDPTRYQLSPAPYGYRWVRVGDDYYLAQTQTGLISQMIMGLVH